MKRSEENFSMLCRAILTLRNEEECGRFLEDLCTSGELRAMEQRCRVAELLANGCVYTEILEKTGASSATISRVNRSLQYGAGGYETVLSRLEEEKRAKEEQG